MRTDATIIAKRGPEWYKAYMVNGADIEKAKRTPVLSQLIAVGVVSKNTAVVFVTGA